MSTKILEATRSDTIKWRFQVIINLLNGKKDIFTGRPDHDISHGVNVSPSSIRNFLEAMHELGVVSKTFVSAGSLPMCYGGGWSNHKQPSLPWILNFPTKNHWCSASRLEDIEEGLRHLREHYREWGITSLAVPALGCGAGQLDWNTVRPVLQRYLGAMEIPVELYEPLQPTPSKPAESVSTTRGGKSPMYYTTRRYYDPSPAANEQRTGEKDGEAVTRLTKQRMMEDLIRSWPSALVARHKIEVFSGGAINRATMANLDSRGEGPPVRLRVGSRVVYPKDVLAEWLVTRISVDKVAEE